MIENRLMYPQQIVFLVPLLNIHTTPKTILKLYKPLIRYILEYDNIIWDPYFTLDNKAVEHVQRRQTKLVGTLKDCTT